VLIISLIVRPEGIMGGRELRWKPKNHLRQSDERESDPAARE
jgi:hypothetical protein